MHALDWLNGRGRILRGAIQPIASVHFDRSRFRSRSRGLCDRALFLCRDGQFSPDSPLTLGILQLLFQIYASVFILRFKYIY